jgi:UDP-N-acetylglucosamine-lysosomal-enzyme
MTLSVGIFAFTIVLFNVTYFALSLGDEGYIGDIDAVYTWVNGTDERHQENLRLLKSRLSHKLELKAFIDYVQANNTIQPGEDLAFRWQQKFVCLHKFCIKSSNLLVLQPVLDFQLIDDINKTFAKIRVSNFPGKNVTLIERTTFDNTVFFKEFYEYLLHRWQLDAGKVYFGYYTSDDCAHLLHCIDTSSDDRTFILKNFDKFEEQIDLNFNFEYKYERVHAYSEFELKIKHNKTVKNVVRISDNDSVNLNLVQMKTKNPERIKRSVKNKEKIEIHKTNIVWDLGNVAKNSADIKSRFNNNDELKYSLRSLETHAPWVRNVYLVTNGQAPSWLNTNNTRIRVIAHDEIFTNKSHLPTFNSAAIETHLHRIDGLSKRFLYFNDDILLGKSISVGDFYTVSNGFKVYLTQRIATCDLYCPKVWLKDGYCDSACNTTDCMYDGGDCKHAIAKTPQKKAPFFFRRKLKNLDVIEENFTNFKILQKVYNDYRTFLSWSIDHGYLAVGAMDYKLSRLHQKIASISNDPNTDLEHIPLGNEHDFRIELDQAKLAYSNGIPFKSRRLLDIYYSSILHVMYLYNQLYGFTTRKMIAHMPHMIDRDIMVELQEKFREEFDRTSSHHFRDETDMQYAFSYFYYIQSETETFDFKGLFRLYDRDNSSALTQSELDEFNLTENLVFKFEQCSNGTKPIEIKLDEFLNCVELEMTMKEKFAAKQKSKKYKSELASTMDISFHMIGSANPNKFDSEIKKLARRMRKFICFNDNIDYTKQSDVESYMRTLKNFYEKYYPKRSSFELDEISDAPKLATAKHITDKTSPGRNMGEAEHKENTTSVAVQLLSIFSMLSFICFLLMRRKFYIIKRYWHLFFFIYFLNLWQFFSE